MNNPWFYSQKASISSNNGNAMEDVFAWYRDNHELFIQKLKEEKDKLPYNINILDEIHANENAHSRILVKILQYKKYENFILKSFLKSLGSPFDTLPVKAPIITAETDRIDLRIRDNDYSIIVENKIHGAKDQDSQIERYIKIEEEHRNHDKKVYVLYLTRSGGAPSECSFSNKETWNKENRNKYKEISFKNHILPWIEELEHSDNLLNIQKKDFELLQSALIQYKNHLQGMFYERDGEKKMEAEMKQYLKSELGLSEDDSRSLDNIQCIEEHFKTLNAMKGFLEGIEIENVINMLKEVVDNINKELGKEAYAAFRPPLKIEGKFGEQNTGIYIIPEDWDSSYSIGFYFDRYLDRFYYGIACTDENIFEELSGILKEVFQDKYNRYDLWIYYNYFDEYQYIEDIYQFAKDIQNGKFKETILKTLLEVYKTVQHIPQFHFKKS